LVASQKLDNHGYENKCKQLLTAGHTFLLWNPRQLSNCEWKS
jgi:hypothetical protein